MAGGGFGDNGPPVKGSYASNGQANQGTPGHNTQTENQANNMGSMAKKEMIMSRHTSAEEKEEVSMEIPVAEVAMVDIIISKPQVTITA